MNHPLRPLVGVLFLLPTLFLGVSCQKAEKAAAPGVQTPVLRVGILTVVPSTFTEEGTYYGKLAGTQSAVLLAVLGGRVDSLAVDEGALVAAGQSLGRVNAEKASATRDLAVLAEKIAKDAFDRQKQFLKDGNASPISVDQGQLAWLTAHNGTIDAEKALTGALCITPVAGIVTRRFVDRYQELAPGSPTFAVSDIDRMKVVIGIPEPEVAGVAVGSSAEVRVAASPGSVWKGSVSRLSRELSSQTLSFEAEVTIENPGHRLLPGTSATVTLRRRTLADQILIPSQAVLSNGDQSFVMVEASGVAHRRPVTTGPTSKTQTVVTQGLVAGDHLIVEGNNLAADGSPVVVISGVQP